jgi:hypothetical protein
LTDYKSVLLEQIFNLSFEGKRGVEGMEVVRNLSE